ncbi:DUF4238 domain-containing protein [Aquincola sp. S2]|uniref:DUF4238 domain-containing protein n=1 Tax=Pseudaquabacterium terrae TaxID=2732868 RepID=A0ABX2EET9_9BURK|nr:DUF4238 domain-containing protein [Aquabacterium terrae]NRF67140.1 DUF4238 domain-containing protein [Aquabacterium terrae]
MTLLVLHLSDIHILHQTDRILKRPQQTAAATFQHLPDASCVAVVISGDIAQAGSKAEYKLAEQFILEVVRAIRTEKRLPVHVILAPGNHDCDFTGEQDARLAVIDNIPKKSGNIPITYVRTATKVQREFFALKRKLENKDILSFDNQLWWTYTFNVDELKVSIDVLNASWMSTKHEQQGNLLFPYEQFKDIDANCDLRIGVLHHPLNWYSQNNYLAFRSFLHRLEDLIVTGHEHKSASRLIDDKEDGECLYIEGACLQSRSSAESAFNIAIIDLKLRRFKTERYAWTTNRYTSTADGSKDWADYRPLPKRNPAELSLSDAFTTELHDPGATLKHPSGRPLILQDFYVFPDFDEEAKATAGGEAKTTQKINSSTLLKVSDLDTDILIQGDDEAGKTRLLYRLMEAYHQSGRLPLLFRGEKVKPSHASDVAPLVKSAVCEQYGEINLAAYLQAPNDRKVFLFDDFDRVNLNAERKNKFLLGLRLRCSRIITTVGENFAVRELFGGGDLLEAQAYKFYKLLPLGHARRHELIKKWIRIGGVESTDHNEFLRACDEAEQLIESTKLQYVATTVPIFVLSLLQANSSGVAAEAHNSAFAHYYYFLIIGALDSAQVPKSDFGLILSVCNHLSWFIKKFGHDQQSITVAEFRKFVKKYSAEWSTISEKDILQILLRSRLMTQDGETIAFTYPYTYYYFLGKYAAIAIKDQDVIDYIQYCLKNLYARECANALLFLAHHTGDSTILTQLVSAVNGHFQKVAPLSLTKADVGNISDLLAQAPQITYQERKPDQFRQTRAEARDRYDNTDGLESKPVEGERDTFHDIISLLKAIEMTGILLTHQFSNYSRGVKNESIRAIFDSSMRAVQDLFNHFRDSADLVDTIIARVQSKTKDVNAEEAEKIIRNGIAFLLRMMTTSFVMKAGSAVKSLDLVDNVQSVVEDNPTPAYRLIKLGQELQRPGRLPRIEISRLMREEAGNPAVMGVLQLLILFRLYMYETSYDDKDWAISLFHLGGAAYARRGRPHEQIPSCQAPSSLRERCTSPVAPTECAAPGAQSSNPISDLGTPLQTRRINGLAGRWWRRAILLVSINNPGRAAIAMPDNKKHHFVPRFYLRRFSANGTSINLFNIPGQKDILNAKLKTQCYRDYFYGKESETEKALSVAEGKVAEYIERIHAERALAARFSEEHLTLCFHVVTQAYRTQHAADTLNEMTDGFWKQVLKDDPRVPPGSMDKVLIGFDEAVRLSLGIAAEHFPVIMDLDWRLLVAGPGSEFIASDTPVVSANQLMSFVKFGSTTGLSWKGLQMFLPLSPTLLLFLFDKDSYVVGDHGEQVIEVAQPGDVDKLNVLQAASAAENVYYLSTAARVDGVVRAAMRFRRPQKAKTSAGPMEETAKGFSQVIATSITEPKTDLELSFIRLRKSATRWRDVTAREQVQRGIYVRNEMLYLRHKEHIELVRQGRARSEDLVFYLYNN